MSLHAQGMRAWLLQRLTAIYIAIYSLAIIVWVIFNVPVNYTSWYALFSHPLLIIATVIFYLSVLIHAWVGVRDIMVDYIKPSSVRFVLLTGLAFALTGIATWLLLIVISLVKV
ncbi:MAG: succinate dehydrogenase, hydrophobic membrane anchor protein [Gammaproteobacteria bacterium]|nr:succinate dehydrogenase, hydrophobic membrane anchor protein [Gammaproteobacteria bacterium]